MSQNSSFSAAIGTLNSYSSDTFEIKQIDDHRPPAQGKAKAAIIESKPHMNGYCEKCGHSIQETVWQEMHSKSTMDLYPPVIRHVENSSDDKERTALHKNETEKFHSCSECGFALQFS